jgi:phage repressor protein C with HTH and peptisase S24 domain
MERDLKTRLLKLVESQGITLETASTRSGLDRSYLRKMLDRPGASPRGETLQKIAAGLGVSATWLLTGDESTKHNEVRPAFTTLPERGSMPNDVPVLGTAAGSHLRGAFQLSADPVDYVRRPPALSGAKDIYALFVEGTSMEPQYNPGDLVYIHPHKPPRFGDAVIIQCSNGADGEMEATIGILAKRTAEAITIRKHNPAAEIQIKRSTILEVHKVLTLNELFGI